MIYPMFAMVLLVLIVAVITFRARIRALRGKEVSFQYFRAMSGSELPAYAQIPSRHFMNLFEVPVLFYVACLAALIMEMTGPTMVTLAWAFVLCRYAQAFIHLTYNNVIHRLYAFATGLFLVITMWVLLVIQVT